MNNLKLRQKPYITKVSCALLDYILQSCIHYQKQNQIVKYGSILK
jgi:uncharacterized cysteine cluster protein YcgN (CxxCxxCC family)